MRYLLFVIATLIISSAHASTMGLVFGWRLNDGTAVTPATSIDGESGLIIGGVGYLPIAGNWNFRTGFMFNQRYYTYKVSTAETEVKLGYVDVPVSIMYKISDMGGVFVGTSLGFKASEKCGSGDCSNTEALLTPAQFGGYFKLGPQLGMEVYYESLSGNLIDEIKDTTAVAASLVISLD